ncbi:MAG TPA: CBS domain-containing protein [Casimicrobiaceae bacterium]|jgi:CBS domain-containing protein|nr:CBS domain-containing protein [Casimicrobiaceae bacterium]
MKTEDVMTRAVVTVGPDATLREAIERMVSYRISGVPVVDSSGKLVGMLTEGDLVRRTEMGTEAPRRRWLELLLGPGSRADDYSRTHGVRVRDVMSPNVVAAARDTPLHEIVRQMEEHAIKRVPVVEKGKLVGIVSRADLVAALAHHLAPGSETLVTDEAIRRRIVAAMKREAWCPSHSLRVSVHDGVARIDGMVFDQRERRALHVLLETMEGVRGIDDRVVCVEPMSGTVVDEPSGGVEPVQR